MLFVWVVVEGGGRGVAAAAAAAAAGGGNYLSVWIWRREGGREKGMGMGEDGGGDVPLFEPEGM